MKKRDTELNSNWGTICPPVEMVAADGRKRKVQAANALGLSSIQSQRAIVKTKNPKGFLQNKIVFLSE